MRQTHKMLEAFGSNNIADGRKAYLHNAYGKEEVEVLNGVGSLKFKMPYDDPKNKFLAPFVFIKSFNGQYYRIINIKRSIEAGGNQCYEYECEHCIATLCDNLMPDWHQVDGLALSKSISYVLNFQKVQHWRVNLSVNQFDDEDHKFSYGWQDENCLNALWSITEVFVDDYLWDYDMSVYPWRIRLWKLPLVILGQPAEGPNYYIRLSQNMLKAGVAEDTKSICTRLYPYGMGEGDNRIDIKDVNNGIEYLEAPKQFIDKYGIIECYLVDREFETAKELRLHAKKILKGLREPRITKTFEVSELFELTHDPIDQATVGTIARFTVDNSDAYIVKTTRNLDVQGDLKIEIANTPEDIVGAINDLAARQRIEMTYAQGATQIYAVHGQGDCTKDEPFHINFWIPSEARMVNYVKVKTRIERFRSYTKLTKSGGGSTRTSTANGSEVVSSENSDAGLFTDTALDGPGTGTFQTTDGQPTSNTDATSLSQLILTGTTAIQTLNITQNTATAGSGNTGNEDVNNTLGVSSNTTGASSAVNTAGASNVETGGAGGGTTGGASATGTGSAGSGSTSSNAQTVPGYFGNTASASGSGSHSHSMSHSHGSNSHSHSGPSHTHTTAAHTHNIGTHTHSMGHTHTMAHTHTIGHTHQFPHKHSIPSHAHSFSWTNGHNHSITLQTAASWGKHAHTFVHKHGYSHWHRVYLSKHTHKVAINNHTHSVTIPEHVHEMDQGIFKYGNATGGSFRVSGKEVKTIGTSDEFDITKFLLSGGKIPRGTWIEISILPNDLAYVTIDLVVQCFIQSRGGGHY